MYQPARQYLSDDVKRAAVFGSGMDAQRNTSTYMQELFDQDVDGDVRDGVASVGFRTQLVDEFLLMTDRFSMAHSLEARTPLLDHELVDLVFRIPSRVRSKPGDLKYLFKKAVEDLLPPALLTAPKSGFVLPLELWLRGKLRPMVEHLLAPDRLRAQGLFRPEFHDRFVRPHLDGKAEHTWQVWAALMFQMWHLVFIEERSAGTPSFSWRDIH
jgi:asparagine synthase (glutamine-hydrolysing)